MGKSFFIRLHRKITINGGVAKRFGIGICIDKWGIDLDLGPFWLSLEWWY